MLILPAERLGAIPAYVAGVGFGVALYVVNLYGFTAIFPWFAQSRGWITLIAHGVFGFLRACKGHCSQHDYHPP
ncbi:MAG: hypothetical protein WB870_07435 [Gallionellaceae bacterium]